MILARKLVKTYPMGATRIRALDDVTLEIVAGEMVAVTGASGSGKSTLMHILGCLDTPDSGTYSLAGQDVSGLSEDQQSDIRRRSIGFIFQTFNLLPRLNALENVELPLLYSSRRDACARAKEALKRVGLANRMRHDPNQLSGGERQRVALARAIVTEPDVILADEPTGSLDTRTGSEILDLLQDLNASGRTVLIVTHDPNVARRCRRQLQMQDGRIVGAA